MKTFAAHDIWGSVAIFPPTALAFDRLVQATVEFVNADTDEDTQTISSAGFAFGNHVVTCCIYQTQGLVESSSLEGFTDLPDRIEQHNTRHTAHRDSPLFVIPINPICASSHDDERVHQVTEGLLAAFKNRAIAKGLLHRYMFAKLRLTRRKTFSPATGKRASSDPIT
ncbi:hypothetical protein K504DRAFT_508519 [Pleomassaria siparia CBS 279.74]|uniref:Uncharacterized protein n=1 Tax=Pleomassaria siparia CBS 279.74 TaxID=1314801 RepID=A0A6G1JRU6_9PLEO|nr:hypothetical protein K504DRAFT_508519 [Pleomassaria siparia CBS 279.74]